MLEIKAKDIMTTDFNTVAKDEPVLTAVRKILEGRTRNTGHRTVSVVVLDEVGNFAGMLSMLDILYHVRPPFFEYILDEVDVKMTEVPHYIDRFKSLAVENVMNYPVPVADPEDHILRLIDLMVKKKVRNLPVLEGNKVVGIVYLSEVYIELCNHWLLAS
ncbi:MAG: CBS domain-containing protein [Thermodesulfobacteriota bacterium]